MLNYIWGMMIIIGVIYGVLTGNVEAITNGAIDSAKEAITLCITMLGVIGFWTGLIEIAKSSGMIHKMTKGIDPFLNFMFPNLPQGHKARDYISLNVISNILGLGWAATPAGLEAMKALEEEGRKNNYPKGVATDEMCTFLILNISSLQLIPVSIIAYRSQYGSVNPTGVIGAGIVATLISTLAGVIFCKIRVKVSCQTERK